MFCTFWVDSCAVCFNVLGRVLIRSLLQPMWVIPFRVGGQSQESNSLQKSDSSSKRNVGARETKWALFQHRLKPNTTAHRRNLDMYGSECSCKWGCPIGFVNRNRPGDGGIILIGLGKSLDLHVIPSIPALCQSLTASSIGPCVPYPNPPTASQRACTNSKGLSVSIGWEAIQWYTTFIKKYGYSINIMDVSEGERVGSSEGSFPRGERASGGFSS